MSQRLQLFVEVNEEEKEMVRKLSYLLRMSQSNIVKAAALPVIRKLAAAVEEPDGIKKVRTVLIQRLDGEA